MSHPYFDLPLPLVLGHRGAAGVAPENTLLAFRRGLELGAHAIESDAHATRDGVPVLIHDDEVGRISDGQGAVAEMTFEELSQLDAAYRYGAGSSHEDAVGPPFLHRGEGHRVPSMREAFEAFPDAPFNIEIKANPPGLVDTVIDLLSELDREDRTLLTAGRNDIMGEIRERCAKRSCRAALGACLGDILGVVESAVSGTAPPPDVGVLQIPVDFADRPLITEALLEHAHAHGILIHAWTINAPEEIERLLSLGVDGIVTDFPQRVVEIAAA